MGSFNFFNFLLVILLIYSMFSLTGCFEDEEMTAALESGDPADCKKLDETDKKGRIDTCLQKMGLEQKDSSICDQIGTESKRDTCYSELVKGDYAVALCEKVSPARMTNCYLNGAEAKGGAIGINICKDLPLVIATKKDDCLVRVAKTEGVHIGVCQDVENTAKKDSCVRNLALGLNSSEYCVQSSRPTKVESCVITIAKQKQDPDVCKQLDLEEPPLSKDNCYLALGPMVKKASVCTEIGDTVKKDNCNYNVAIKKGEWEVCERIGGIVQRDKCYDNVGRSQRDLEACKRIIDAEKKENCENIVTPPEPVSVE